MVGSQARHHDAGRSERIIKMKFLIMILTVIAVTGCQRAPVSIESTLRPEDRLTDPTRNELHLPSRTELTLANKTDKEYVKNLTPETIKVIEMFLKPTGNKFQINAVRPVGDHLLPVSYTHLTLPTILRV